MKKFVQLFENFTEGSVNQDEILNIFKEQGLEAAIAAAKAAGMSKEEFTALVSGDEAESDDNLGPFHAQPQAGEGMHSDENIDIVDGQ